MPSHKITTPSALLFSPIFSSFLSSPLPILSLFPSPCPCSHQGGFPPLQPLLRAGSSAREVSVDQNKPGNQVPLMSNDHPPPQTYHPHVNPCIYLCRVNCLLNRTLCSVTMLELMNVSPIGWQLLPLPYGLSTFVSTLSSASISRGRFPLSSPGKGMYIKVDV